MEYSNPRRIEDFINGKNASPETFPIFKMDPVVLEVMTRCIIGIRQKKKISASNVQIKLIYQYLYYFDNEIIKFIKPKVGFYFPRCIAAQIDFLALNLKL